MRKDIEMSAGLPATGLGGALYLLLIVWMLFRQVASTARGDSFNASQWRFIIKMVLIATTMVAVTIGEVMLFNGARTLAISNIPVLANFLIPRSNLFVLLMASIPFILLPLVMLSLHVLRLAIGIPKTERAQGVEGARETFRSTRMASDPLRAMRPLKHLSL
jgi:hypothetical protein